MQLHVFRDSECSIYYYEYFDIRVILLRFKRNGRLVESADIAVSSKDRGLYSVTYHYKSLDREFKKTFTLYSNIYTVEDVKRLVNYEGVSKATRKIKNTIEALMPPF